MHETGRVFHPEHAPWLEEYEAEILGYPNGKFDDWVDSTSLFLNWFHQRRKLQVNVSVGGPRKSKIRDKYAERMGTPFINLGGWKF